ncbi:MAG: flagellar biosynthesis protein FlhB [Nitrospirota bacterium]
MADHGGNRTEQATPKRKAEARKKGQVAVSRDVSTAAVLLGGIGILYFLLVPALNKLTWLTREWLSSTVRQASRNPFTVARFHEIVTQMGPDALLVVLPLVVGVAVVSVGSSLLQTGFLWRPEAVRFELGRLSPLNGLKRMVSLRSAAELIKSLLKVAAIGGVGFLAVYKDLGLLPELVQYDLEGALAIIGWLTFRAAAAITFAMAGVAAADYVYQRFEWERSLRMTKQEVKEEQRDAEGEPMIRARVRSVQREMAKKRMLAAVPSADVVVRNPTHYAVALKYDQAKMAAPIVVAKGAGYVAERIVQAAREHGVAIVENAFVARTLYKLVEVGREIPADLYRAVAEILAFVYRARGILPRVGSEQ